MFTPTNIMKVSTSITLDLEIITQARAKGINLSKEINEYLKVMLSSHDNPSQDLNEIKKDIDEATAALATLNKQKELLETKVKKKQEEKEQEAKKWRVVGARAKQ